MYPATPAFKEKDNKIKISKITALDKIKHQEMLRAVAVK